MRFSQVQRDILIIIAAVLGSTLLLYLPFFTHSLSLFGFNANDAVFDTIYRNYDGVLYIVPAKTGYYLSSIKELRLELPLPAQYFAAHLPLYPVVIRMFAEVIGYLKGMIAATIFSSILFAVLFYSFLRSFHFSKTPLFLTLVVLMYPRLFILRLVGSPELLFMTFIIGSIWAFERRSYFLAGICGMAAVMTKLPGILLFIAFFAVILERVYHKKHIDIQSLYILLIPTGAVVVFAYYWYAMGDFFAFFHTGGVVPILYPYSVFHTEARWVGTAWLEDVIFDFILYGSVVLALRQFAQRSIFYFSLIFFAAAICVQHRDVSRYLIPLLPFAGIAFADKITTREGRILFFFLLPAVYLFSLNFLLSNILPIADWRPYL